MRSPDAEKARQLAAPRNPRRPRAQDAELGPRHGFAILRWIEETSDDAIQVEEGSLYPALYKLEENGLIVADWGITEHNRRAKFYRLTAAGKKHLRTSHDYWAKFAKAVTRVLEISPKPA